MLCLSLSGAPCTVVHVHCDGKMVCLVPLLLVREICEAQSSALQQILACPIASALSDLTCPLWSFMFLVYHAEVSWSCFRCAFMRGKLHTEAAACSHE